MPFLKPRAFIYLILILLLSLLPACATSGRHGRFNLIFAPRADLEKFCIAEGIDPHRYRLGRDVVVFVWQGGEGGVTTLYMSPASEYTPDELRSMRPASCRPGMPGRNDPMLRNLRTAGLGGEAR